MVSCNHVFQPMQNCDPLMYNHPFALLNSWNVWYMVAPLPCWLLFHMMDSCTYLPRRQPWAESHSSVQLLTPNYLDSCFLSTLTLTHKRDFKSQWGDLSESPTLGEATGRSVLNTVCFNQTVVELSPPPGLAWTLTQHYHSKYFIQQVFPKIYQDWLVISSPILKIRINLRGTKLFQMKPHSTETQPLCKKVQRSWEVRVPT